MLFAGREVRILEKAVPAVWRQTKDTVVSCTDRPRPVNNLFIIIFFSVLVFKMIDANRFANSLPALRRTVTR